MKNIYTELSDLHKAENKIIDLHENELHFYRELNKIEKKRVSGQISDTEARRLAIELNNKYKL